MVQTSKYRLKPLRPHRLPRETLIWGNCYGKLIRFAGTVPFEASLFRFQDVLPG
jgi:hypothetical protein